MLRNCMEINTISKFTLFSKDAGVRVRLEIPILLIFSGLIVIKDSRMQTVGIYSSSTVTDFNSKVI